MTKFVRGLIFWPLVFAAVALAVANRNMVQFSFDPFSAASPAFAITTPVFLILMAGVLIGIVLGGLSAWADQAHWRRIARASRKRVAQLEAELAQATAPKAPPASSTALSVRRAG